LRIIRATFRLTTVGFDMAQRPTLAEIRERTFKSKDAWWTVLLVDPVAARLVRLVAPYRWITPNVLTLVATVIGLGSAVCFALGGRWWLVAGAVLFHVSFVVDCMDGKIARLNGTGSIFGGWFDFMFDRLRVFVCTLGLFGGQYAHTHQAIYLWLSTIVIFLDLFRYLNGGQIAKYNRQMNAAIKQARGVVVTSEPEPDPETAQTDAAEPAPGSAAPAPTSLPGRIRAELRRRRIRPHLVSGIEFEMFVFIIGPLIGFVIATTIVSGALLLAFELLLTLRLFLATQRFPARLARAEEEGRARAEAMLAAGAVTPANRP
jgi:phosphatidylglycerophosphate synthase